MDDTTPYNKLPLYTTGSVADLRDDYNRAMQLIDKKLHQLDVQIQIHNPEGI
nr:MAG TPA: hypothetical protein [Bacteriophage sp.]